MSGNKERKAQMEKMLQNGATYSEIAAAFGISRQRAYSIIGGRKENHYKKITAEDCVYPNLRKWLNENRVTRAELCRRLTGSTHPKPYTKVLNFCRGNTSRATKQEIDKYLRVTGLTYEELFATEAGNCKQTDHTREIFAEVENIINRYCNDYKYSIGDVLYDFTEVRKKYTEN